MGFRGVKKSLVFWVVFLGFYHNMKEKKIRDPRTPSWDMFFVRPFVRSPQRAQITRKVKVCMPIRGHACGLSFGQQLRGGGKRYHLFRSSSYTLSLA